MTTKNTAKTAKTTKAKKSTGVDRNDRLLKRNTVRAKKVEKLIEGLREWVGVEDEELSKLCEDAAKHLDRYHTILGSRAEKYAARIEA
jgi:ethanolamine utilization cobalamin adenosyltransferase